MLTLSDFRRLEDCYDKCQPTNVCDLPKVVGPCDAVIPRYYYNKATKKCDKFNFGGCGANGNNFE